MVFFFLEIWGYSDIGFGIDVRWNGGNGEEFLIVDDLFYVLVLGLDVLKWMMIFRVCFICLVVIWNGYLGEVFVGYMLDGKKYFFDWGVEKFYVMV